jgi:predicted PurR-regulated permease PerM
MLSTLPDEPTMWMGDPEKDLWENLGTIATTTMGGLLDFLVFIVVGVSLAIEPNRYIDALVRLAPIKNRPRAREIFTILGEQLESWLVARFLTMVAVGLITAMGLWLLGVPNILVLSLLAGLLEFIPVVGPILASVPAILLGLLISPLFAFYIALFYWFVQSLESYLISPLLHQKIVKLAPALVIIAELVMALTLGFIGLVIATPLLVVTIVLIRLVYLENILGDDQGDLKVSVVSVNEGDLFTIDEGLIRSRRDG